MPHRCRNLHGNCTVGRIQMIGQPVHLVGEQMPVQVQGHLDARVAQVGLDGLGMGSLGDEDTGMASFYLPARTAGELAAMLETGLPPVVELEQLPLRAWI
jgi:hypothetical protein